jgi:hypothetical protein
MRAPFHPIVAALLSHPLEKLHLDHSVLNAALSRVPGSPIFSSLTSLSCDRGEETRTVNPLVFPGLRRLNLRAVHPENADLRPLRHLRSFSIRNVDRRDLLLPSSVENLRARLAPANFSALSGLKKLCINGHHRKWLECGTLLQHTALESLRLYRCEKVYASSLPSSLRVLLVKECVGLVHLTALEKLSISPGPEAFEAVRVGLPLLRRLYLEGCEKSLKPQLLEIAAVRNLEIWASVASLF